MISVTVRSACAQPDSGGLIVSAVSLYSDGQYDKAAGLLDRIIAHDADSDAAWYYRAMCALAQQDAGKAELCLEEAAGLDPDNFWYRYRLAGLYAMTSRAGLAAEMYEKLLADFPKRSELYFDLAELYSAQGENEKALETLSEIETVFGITESVAVYRFNILMRMKRQEEAYRSLEEYNSRYSSPYVLSVLAEHQLSEYKDSVALAYYDEALDIAPDYAPALLGKAEILRMTRRYDEYFDILDDFVSNPSDSAESKLEYLSAVIGRSDGNFLRNYRSCFEDAMRKVKRTHPSSVPAAAGYVEFLMYARRWEELSREGRAAYERFPQETSFLEMASVGDYNLGRYDEVLEICDKVLTVAPDDSSSTLRAWSTKGDIYHRLGKVKEAYRAYDNALKINPEYVYVLNNYAYYLSMQGRKLRKAYEMSRKTIMAEPDNATYLDTFGWILFLMGKPLEAKPHFKHAMLYGGKESAVILDHYAEVLFALGEYDKAMVYWNQAMSRNDGEIPDLEERIRERKRQMEKNTGK